MSDSMDDIAETLRHVLTLPVNVSDGNFREAPPRFRLFPSTEGVMAYFGSVLGWLPLNPSKQDVRDAIRETYVHLEYERDGGRTIPATAAFKSLYEDVTDDAIKCIYVTGDRGCGKTAALNFFLNENHARLNSEARMTWFRSDVSKIYSSLSGVDPGTDITLLEYAQAHMLFVVLAHCDSDLLLAGFRLSGRKADTGNFFASALDGKEDREVIDTWIRVVHTYFSYDDAPIQFIDSVVKGIRRPAENAFDRLIAAVTRYIRGKGRNERNRIVQIIDGIDNIDRKRDAERYQRFLRQLLNFAGIQQKPHALYDKTIVVLRHETLLDLQRIESNVIRIYNSDESQVIQYSAHPVEPLVLLQHKCDAILNPKSRYFVERKHRAVATPGYDPIWERSLFTLAQLYVDQLDGAVNPHSSSRPNTAGRQVSSGASVLSTVFNNDLRTMCQNLLLSTRYLRAYLKAAENRGVSVEPDVLLQKMQERPYLILEGSITGGGPFMPKDNLQTRGRWCPNLFHFSLSDETRNWMGLCLLRVLQFLAHHPTGNVTEEMLIEQLGSNLGYPKADIEEAIATAWAYGLMLPFDTMRFRRTDADVLRLTAKGNFLMRAPFADPAITYFMAASTRLHAEIFDDSKCFDVHDPSGNGPRRFVPATIKTSLSLIRHVKSAHAREMAHVGSSEMQRVFALPSLDQWVSRAVGYCVSFSRANRSGCHDLLRDLKGIAT